MHNPLLYHKRLLQEVFCIGFLHTSGSSFTARIKNCNRLVIHYQDTKFLLWRDSRKTAVTSQVARQEIEMLNNAPNGSFLTIDRDNRINFELIYKLIVDNEAPTTCVPRGGGILLCNS